MRSPDEMLANGPSSTMRHQSVQVRRRQPSAMVGKAIPTSMARQPTGVVMCGETTSRSTFRLRGPHRTTPRLRGDPSARLALRARARLTEPRRPGRAVRPDVQVGSERGRDALRRELRCVVARRRSHDAPRGYARHRSDRRRSRDRLGVLQGRDPSRRTLDPPGDPLRGHLRASRRILALRPPPASPLVRRGGGGQPADSAPANWPENHDGMGTVPEDWPSWRAFWADEEEDDAMSGRLADRVAIVTGAGDGIGLAGRATVRGGRRTRARRGDRRRSRRHGRRDLRATSSALRRSRSAPTSRCAPMWRRWSIARSRNGVLSTSS